MLAKELGVEPQPATQALVARIRSGERDLGVLAGYASTPPPAPVAPPASSGKVHLPPRPPAFFGRAAEVSQVAARLADPDCRLLTVLGPGGMGKTLLAIEAARAQGEHFADGVWFVDLAPVNAPDLIIGAILRALALPPAGPGAATARLTAHLEARQTLLVIDNFEHLRAGANLLPPLLHAAPGLKLLVTSRVRLHLAEEWLLPLDGLATPPVAAAGSTPGDAFGRGEQSALGDFASLRLFVQRMQQLSPSAQPTPADLQQIAEICRLLEGMPLGIELAAALVRSLSLAELAQAVRGRLELFTSTLRDLPVRHRSMHAVFDHSWRLLDARERGLLRQLSVFRGGCTLAAAAAVAGASPADLESLLDKSWLRVHERRFTMHELMRQYCAEKLDQEHESEAGEPAEEVYRRHCVRFAGVTGAEEQALNWQREPMAIFSADFGNLEAAWFWAIAHGDFAATRRMMNSLFFFAEMTGWFGAMLPFFESATRDLRTRWRQAEDDAPQRQAAALLLTNLLYIQLTLLQHLGWLTRVRACLDEMRAVLAAAVHDERWQESDFLAHCAETWLALELGEFAAAYPAARDLLTFLQNNDLYCYPWRAEIGTRFWQMHLHSTLGSTARLLGDYGTARTHSEAAISLNDAMGERRFKARNLREIATLLRLRGDYEQALVVAQSALTLSQSFEDRINAAYGELTLGQIEIDADHYTPAGEHCRRSLAVALETGAHRLHIRSLVALARIERLLGHPAAARRRLEEAVSACTQPDITHSNHLAAVLLELGHVACAEHDWSQARQLYAEALAAKGHDAAEAQEALAGLAEVAWAENDRARAEQLLTQVIGNPATAAAPRQRAEQLLMRWRGAGAPGYSS